MWSGKSSKTTASETLEQFRVWFWGKNSNASWMPILKVGDRRWGFRKQSKSNWENNPTEIQKLFYLRWEEFRWQIPELLLLGTVHDCQHFSLMIVPIISFRPLPPHSYDSKKCWNLIDEMVCVKHLSATSYDRYVVGQSHPWVRKPFFDFDFDRVWASM